MCKYNELKPVQDDEIPGEDKKIGNNKKMEDDKNVKDMIRRLKITRKVDDDVKVVDKSLEISPKIS